MTNRQSPEAAAALLDEVGKRRHAIRRRMGNGWFELAVFGGALLAVAVAGLAGNPLGRAQAVACAVVMSLAYVAVGVRYLRLRRQFGFDLYTGLLLSAVIFSASLLASWLFDGTAQSAGLALIPAAGVSAMALRWGFPAFGLAAVILGGAIVAALPGTPEWTAAAVYGIGFLVLGVAALRRVDHDQNGTV